MADLLDSILGSMEKPPVLDAEKKKARGELNSTEYILYGQFCCGGNFRSTNIFNLIEWRKA